MGSNAARTLVRARWPYHVTCHCILDHSGQQQLFHSFDIASVVERAKHQHAFEYFADNQHMWYHMYTAA